MKFSIESVRFLIWSLVFMLFKVRNDVWVLHSSG